MKTPRPPEPSWDGPGNPGANVGVTTLFEREPVRVFLAGLAAIVVFALEASNLLGWTQVDRAQLAAIEAFIAAACAWVAKILRTAVTSPATAQELAEDLRTARRANEWSSAFNVAQRLRGDR